MIDIDHFKKLNDRFGHLAGDAVLMRMAAILADAIREVDYAARYGGEEFLLLLPETATEGAVKTAERIRVRLGKERFAGYDKKMKVTVSVGVAEFPKHGDTPESIIASADTALYQAKRRGRNRVVRTTLTRRKTATRKRGKKARRRA